MLAPLASTPFRSLCTYRFSKASWHLLLFYTCRIMCIYRFTKASWHLLLLYTCRFMCVYRFSKASWHLLLPHPSGHCAYIGFPKQVGTQQKSWHYWNIPCSANVNDYLIKPLPKTIYIAALKTTFKYFKTNFITSNKSIFKTSNKLVFKTTNKSVSKH